MLNAPAVVGTRRATPQISTNHQGPLSQGSAGPPILYTNRGMARPGSNPERRCPRVMAGRRRTMCRSLVVPLDGSPLAERALPYAESLAGVSGARLALVRAIQARALPGQKQGEARMAPMEEAEAYLEQTARRIAGRISSSRRRTAAAGWGGWRWGAWRMPSCTRATPRSSWFARRHPTARRGMPIPSPRGKDHAGRVASPDGEFAESRARRHSAATCDPRGAAGIGGA